MMRMQTILVEVVLVFPRGARHHLEIVGPPDAPVSWFVQEALACVEGGPTATGAVVFLGEQTVSVETVLGPLPPGARFLLRVVFPEGSNAPASPPGIATEFELKLDTEGDSDKLGLPGFSSDSEFELTLDEEPVAGPAPQAGPEKDVFEESDFDEPAVEESGSESVALEEGDLDLESDFELDGESATVQSGAHPSIRYDEGPDLLGVPREAPSTGVVDLEEEVIPRSAASLSPQAPQRRPQAERHATVRYYNRMNPDRMYPLVVALTKEEIAAVAAPGVGQKSARVQAAEGSMIEVEPILPGCDCYPSLAQVTVGADAVVTFYVVPHLVGPVHTARVVLRQRKKTLAEIPLDIRVRQQTTAIVLGLAGLTLPFASALMRHYKVDFESQLDEGFSLYFTLIQTAIQAFSPGVLAGALLVATGMAYLWLRPRKQVVLWDLAQPEAPQPRSPGRLRPAFRSAARFSVLGVFVGFLIGAVALGGVAVTSSVEQAVRVAPLLLGPLPVLGFLGGVLGGAIDGALAGEEG